MVDSSKNKIETLCRTIFENVVANFPDKDKFAAVCYLDKPNHEKKGTTHDFDTVILADRKRPIGETILASFELNSEYQKRLKKSGIKVIPFIYSITMEERAKLGNYNPTNDTLLHHSMIFADYETLMEDGIVRGWFAKNIEKNGIFIKGSMKEAFKKEFFKKDKLAMGYFYVLDAMNCCLIDRTPKDWLEWKLTRKIEYVRKWAGLSKIDCKGKSIKELLEIGKRTFYDLDKIQRTKHFV